MELSSIFTKPVDRTIEGVIKADDEASLRLEVEEYVLTNEVSKRLEEFLDAYNNYAGANGVWISGFFGSGKSHLLKILALLLANRHIDGIPVLDIFLSKPGLQDNEILRGDLKRAVAIPSQSILFNIDQKADVISKTQTDALLAVFVKVFDEMCGYYGKQGHIAQFERELDSRGIYTAYKQFYKDFSGKDWTVGREQALLESNNIAEAYARATGNDKASAIGILDKYRSQYKVSIEDFAEEVHKYIESKGPNFRLNFFVDEVGQYIAGNIKLMTNLQTIAESLATKSRGRAWIFVTAQEDMKDVVGEMTSRQSNDFSKIQARFASRMKLTSADVAEVIQKRLLMKNETGVQKLSEIYHTQYNNFKTLFDFADGSQTYRNFQDRDHFIHSFPFIPYQFTLFQAAIQCLSEHNAFEGKHSSVGERSMLAVFQQVAVHIADQDIGRLATFDLMFEGLRSSLKAQIQRAVLTAEKNLDNPFAISLLKALFLVKYVRQFKATIRNLCVLMRESFDQDLPALRRDVEEALNLLEHQTYIQRNGEQYEYLTDEEKDIEQEIKNTEIESADVADELAKIIFDGIIRNRKIRYDEHGQDYPFTRKLDDRLVGREYELAIHVTSPFYEHCGNDSILRSQSMGRDELLVCMPPDDYLVRYLTMYKRTEKYIKQNISITQQDGVKRILTDKTLQNQERHRDLQQHVGKLLGKANLIIQGGDVEIGGEDPNTRIVKGFYELISRAYRNLKMLRGITYTENDIPRCLKMSSDSLFENDLTAMPESEQEMLAFILGNNRGGLRTTLKGLLENFECKPYGWYYAAILCTLAKLCARGKVEARSDANLLEDAELERALRNTHGYANIILEPQIDFTPSQIRQLKEFYADFFDKPAAGGEAKTLGKETGASLKELIHELEPMAVQKMRYPFLSVLDEPLAALKGIADRPYTFYLTEFSREREDLLDLKENILEPIRRFMNGSQKSLYDEARKFLQLQEPNFPYGDADEAEKIREALNDPHFFKGNRMQQVKTIMDALRAELNAKLEEEKKNVRNTIQQQQAGLSAMVEFAALSSERQSQLILPFEAVLRNLGHQTLIAVIRDTLRRFQEEEYPQILTKLSAWSRPEPETKEYNPGSTEKPLKIEEKQIEYVTGKAIKVEFDKPWLADESDVDRYLTKLKETLMKEIASGKRIQI